MSLQSISDANEALLKTELGEPVMSADGVKKMAEFFIQKIAKLQESIDSLDQRLDELEFMHRNRKKPTGDRFI